LVFEIGTDADVSRYFPRRFLFLGVEYTMLADANVSRLQG